MLLLLYCLPQLIMARKAFLQCIVTSFLPTSIREIYGCLLGRSLLLKFLTSKIVVDVNKEMLNQVPCITATINLLLCQTQTIYRGGISTCWSYSVKTEWNCSSPGKLCCTGWVFNIVLYFSVIGMAAETQKVMNFPVLSKYGSSFLSGNNLQLWICWQFTTKTTPNAW